MKRTIEKIIIHCSGTPEGVDVKAGELTALQRKKKPLYHYVIEVDGNIVNTLPLDKAGEHCPLVKYSSIGICYVGGVAGDGAAKNTMTPEQNDSLISLLTILREEFPEVKVYGCNELDTASSSPGFDVQRWLLAVGC